MQIHFQMRGLHCDLRDQVAMFENGNLGNTKHIWFLKTEIFIDF